MTTRPLPPPLAEERGLALAECVLGIGVLLGALIALSQPPAAPVRADSPPASFAGAPVEPLVPAGFTLEH